MAAKKNGPAKASASLAPKRRGRPRKAAEKPVEEQEDQELDEEEIAPAPKSKTAPRSPKKPVVPVSSNSEHENGNGKADDEEDDDVDEAPQKKSSSKTKATKGKAKATPMPKSKRTANSAGSSTSKRAKKAETGDDDDDDEDETEEYEVEKILDIKNMKGGKREFLIKWKGWGMDQTTWEPEEHLQCKELLDAFISKIDALKGASEHQLRVARQQTQRYQDANRNPGVRTSRRFTSKPRQTYHGLDE